MVVTTTLCIDQRATLLLNLLFLMQLVLARVAAHLGETRWLPLLCVRTSMQCFQYIVLELLFSLYKLAFS